MSSGTLLQVNRSRGGLPKRAVSGVVALSSDGVEGDWQRNREVHGGPDKAVLMLAIEVVRDLAAKGFPVAAGSLGENLTVEGLDPSLWRHGQRYRIGATAVIELTKLRQPCVNLNRYGPAIKQEIYDLRCKDGDYTSPYWARGGFYARVIQIGLVAAGVPVVLESDIA
jgi:MOSC domain-containing protein YiiM